MSKYAKEDLSDVPLLSTLHTTRPQIAKCSVCGKETSDVIGSDTVRAKKLEGDPGVEDYTTEWVTTYDKATLRPNKNHEHCKRILDIEARAGSLEGRFNNLSLCYDKIANYLFSTEEEKRPLYQRARIRVAQLLHRVGASVWDE